MSARLCYLPNTDERWKCGGTVELVSGSVDPDLSGVGGSPFGGRSATGVSVPSDPTTDLSKRYLIRLVGVEIPQGYAIAIRGLRQAILIHSEQDQPDGSKLVIEREVVSPFWRFMDGNVSWHLMYTTNVFSKRVFDAAQQPGTSPDFRGYDSALIYRPPLVPYTPPASGRPPGAAIADMGNFTDIRYPWEKTSWTMNQIVSGPGSVIFYASVKQTDPTVRPAYPTTCEGMRPEDKFIANFPDAIYNRVAGAMTVDLLPCKEK